MITNNKESDRRDDIKLLFIVIACFLLVIWFFTPPGNKFAQICLFGNNTKYLVAKLTLPKEEFQEWKLLHNSAVYLMQIDKPTEAIKKINESINKFPTYLPDSQLDTLYLNRAKMLLYIGDYTGALSDYSRLKNLSAVDNFRVALLHKQNGNNKFALQYCNTVLNLEPRAYIGYACVADIYAGAGKNDVAVRVFDLLIDKFPNRARYYADRAMYKKKAGDVTGYVQDLDKAKSIIPNIEEESTIIYDTLHPKKLDVKVLK